ncbi:MAG: Gfo/Idh/MocA family oxidoreductase [Acidobacteriota bacterium]
MAEKVKVGIVGASGWMAGALAAGVEYDEGGFDHGAGQGRKSEASRVSALCDLNREVMESRREELDLDSAVCFDSYEDLLRNGDVDAVIIAVPNHLHVEFAVRALEAGKHLFLEKPFATTREDSRRLSKAVKNCNLTTKLDYILVHYDEQENLRSLIEEGAFGELASVHFTYRHPIQVSQSAEQVWKLSRALSGGAVPMGICHAVSTAVYQVGTVPEKVICKSSPPRIRTFDYDTQMDIIIIFDNNVTAVVQGNIDFAEKYDARHTVIGTAGQFDYNPFNSLESRVRWSSVPRGRMYSPDPDFARHHLDSGDVWEHQCGRTVKAFIRHVLKGEKDQILGLESPLVRHTEAVIWAAEASAVNGSCPVTVDEFLV